MEFLQLWILPDSADLTPSVQQRQFLKAQRTDTLLQVVGAAGDDLITVHQDAAVFVAALRDRKSTRLNSSHSQISYAVFCLKKKKKSRLHMRHLLCTHHDV